MTSAARTHAFLQRAVRSILAAIVVLAVLPAAASATTVELESEEEEDSLESFSFTVDGGAGEANDIRVAFEGGRVRIRDLSADVRLDRGGDEFGTGSCRQVSARELSCSATIGKIRAFLEIDGNDGDDAITVDLGCCVVSVRGGAGRDRIRLNASRSRYNDVSVFLRDGEPDQVSCGGSRVALRVRDKDPEDEVDDCPGRGGDDDDGGGGDAPPPPADAARAAATECGIFNQNFVRDNTVGGCTAAGVRGLANPRVPALTVCQQARFSGRQPRGFRRSDLGACELAVSRTRGRYYFAGGFPTPPPADAGGLAGIECGVFRQNFVRDNTVGGCTAAGVRGLANPRVPALTVCQQARFSGRQPRGFARSDLEACELAVIRTRARYFFRFL